MIKLSPSERKVLKVSDANLPLSPSHYCVVCSTNDYRRAFVYAERFSVFRSMLRDCPDNYNDNDIFSYTLVRLF